MVHAGPPLGRAALHQALPGRGRFLLKYKGKSGDDAWQAICDDTPGCKAVTVRTPSDNCAYLKAMGRDVIDASGLGLRGLSTIWRTSSQNHG